MSRSLGPLWPHICRANRGTNDGVARYTETSLLRPSNERAPSRALGVRTHRPSGTHRPSDPKFKEEGCTCVIGRHSRKPQSRVVYVLFARSRLADAASAVDQADERTIPRVSGGRRKMSGQSGTKWTSGTHTAWWFRRRPSAERPCLVVRRFALATVRNHSADVTENGSISLVTTKALPIRRK